MLPLQKEGQLQPKEDLDAQEDGCDQSVNKMLSPVVYKYRNRYVNVYSFEDLPSSFIVPFTPANYKEVCSKTSKKLRNLREAIFLLFDFVKLYMRIASDYGISICIDCKEELRYLLIDVSTTATELTHIKLGHCKFVPLRMLDHLNTAKLTELRFERLVVKFNSLPW